MRYKVEIKDLGRNRVNFSKEVEGLNYGILYGIVKPHLASSYPEFCINENGEGIIFAGFHSVGKFKVTPIEV